MRKSPIIIATILSLLITAPCLVASVHGFTNYLRTSAKPKIMVWAWERSETLSYINDDIGISFYAGTINLLNNDFSFQPRIHPLAVPHSTYLEAVIRINNATNHDLQLSNSTMKNLIAVITEIAARPNIKSIQIDYDAKESERPFYHGLLSQIRAALPLQFPLCMTALASWCLGDNWLTNMPADEIVPMFFDMGADRQDVLSFIQCAKLQQLSLLQKCVGLSIKEKYIGDKIKQRLTNFPQRIYFFSAQPWNATKLETVKREAQAWF